jgi:4-diphosphocytidyl-2-C-methyl-D-erythritol kinase
MSAIDLAAPAKVNLALHITGRGADGYHLLDSLVTFTQAGDVVTVEAAASDSFAVSGPFSRDVPSDGANLVLSARDFLRMRDRDAAFPVAIHLQKNLPVASGIGGGSSDAAAALRALATLWGIQDQAWQRDVVTLGADLPMCLAAKPLRARGIGEEVETVTLPCLDMVLVNPGVGVSTPKVFAALDSRDNPPLPEVPGNLDAQGLAGWLQGTRNDLEAPALKLAPQIKAALLALQEAGALLARMSGSGATCFGLFSSTDEASAAAASILRKHPGWFVVGTRTLPSTSSAGARDNAAA